MLNVKFINSKELLKIFGTIENILKKNKEDNKLKYIKLENLNNKLCISARNQYMRIKYIIQDTLEIEGDAVLYDSKTLISLLNVLEDEIQIKEQTISNAKCEYVIPYIDVEGYPDDILPNIINKKELNTEEFKEAIIKVLPATNPAIDVLSGIYLDKNKLVACDQNRIFINKINIKEELENIILPRELVNEFLKLPFNESVYISIFGNNIMLEDENLLISSNTINKKYPKYEAILPKEEKNKITFHKKDLEKAINLMLPIINKETLRIDLNFKNSNIIITCKNGNKRGDTSIDIESNVVEDFTTLFNAQYLIDMLKAHKEEIEITIYKDNLVFNFESENSQQYIMPLLD